MLFSPVKIGGMELKNRVALAPMANYMTGEDGSMSEAQSAFLVRRAKGGTGLLIVGSLYVQHPIGRFGIGQLGIYDDSLIPGYQKMTAAAHVHGAKVAAQLHHAGRATCKAWIHDQQPVAPSPIAVNIGKYVDTPRELSKADIAEIVGFYRDAARRCRDAGFDGIEIHMAHGYLPCQFMSPLSNKRADEYGGSLENRMRFPREVLQAVIEGAGPGIPVWCRIVGDELRGEEGIRLEDAKLIARSLVEAGSAAISVSQGMAPYFLTVPNYRSDQGCMVGLASAIKGVVDVPILTAGRITDADFAESVLRAGSADIINLGRALICDPDWVAKAQAGAIDDICGCLGCNVGCQNAKRKVRHTVCLANAECGRESHFDIRPAAVSRKILVVGGGPAGLEFARVAQLRGHRVTLMEKNPYLGGQFYLGSLFPRKEAMGRLIGWWQRQAAKAGVRIELGKQVTEETVRQFAPDVLLVATGGQPAVPPIAGVGHALVVTAHDVLAGACNVGHKVVVIGGGQTGSEIAEWLAAKGKDVTLVEILEDIATTVPPDEQYWVKTGLAKLGARVLTSTLVKEIGEHSVTVSRVGAGDALDWTATIADVDNVVLAAGVKPVRGLADELAGMVPEVFVVGDASTPGNAMEAVAQAAILAREI